MNTQVSDLGHHLWSYLPLTRTPRTPLVGLASSRCRVIKEPPLTDSQGRFDVRSNRPDQLDLNAITRGRN
jgi:hypothetical protein